MKGQKVFGLITFPTSRDIYIEVDGRRLAAAQSYKAKSTQDSRSVEAFGSSEPVGTVGGKVRHLLELTRVRLLDPAGQDFYGLDDFNVVIVKPNRKIIYSGCRWLSIDETVNLGDLVYETLSLVACRRLEVGL